MFSYVVLCDAMRIRRWCPGAESNHRHRDFQSRALPTELPGRRPGPKARGRRARGVIEGRFRPVQIALRAGLERRLEALAARPPAGKSPFRPNLGRPAVPRPRGTGLLVSPPRSL